MFQLTISDLDPYPKLSYDQGRHNSFYFWEEVLADYTSRKSIIVSDRATLFNLAIRLNGYTISSGIINANLNGSDIISRPLVSSEAIEIGYVTNDIHTLKPIAHTFLELLIDRLEAAVGE